MSFETDNLKREISHIKMDLHRKVDNEDFNRTKNDLDKAERQIQNMDNRISEFERKQEEQAELIQAIIEKLNP